MKKKNSRKAKGQQHPSNKEKSWLPAAAAVVAAAAALTVILPKLSPRRDGDPLPAAQVSESAAPAASPGAGIPDAGPTAETAGPASGVGPAPTAESTAPAGASTEPEGAEEPEDVPEVPQEAITLSEDGTAVLVDTVRLSDSAVFFDYDADGVTVELFAVNAPDGSARLALNTCQVCNGSPYAYFEQSGDLFVCQNCMNLFSNSQVGVVSGGCNPVPITSADYEERDGVLSVPVTFLSDNAYRFTNWKKF